MNHEFVVKIMQAKKMEYEAIKEILPDKLLKHIDKLEIDMIDIMKELAISGFEDKGNNKSKSGVSKEKKIKKVEIEL